MAFVGSMISLISTSEVRYVGVLHAVNPVASTVALESVRSYGTEGRLGDPAQEMPPSDRVFEYIVFRGGDIKDLKVLSLPPQGGPVPNDPAILSNVEDAVPDISKLNITEPEKDEEEEKPEPARKNPPPKPPVTEQLPSFNARAGDASVEGPEGDRQQQQRAPMTYDRNSQGAPQQRYNNDSGNNYNQSRGRGGRGGFRGGRGRVGGGNYRNNNNGNNIRTRVPDSDYDFESANAKFDRSELKFPAKPDQANGEEEKVSPDNEEPTSPSNFYDKTSSFFDNISCEARDRAEGERRRVRQNEERRLNMETFGQVSIDGQRGGHRRGNYRRGRGGRGYNNNNNNNYRGNSTAPTSSS
ncbi:hypothetical protein HDU97_000650 [Phlyctochytrium planicorne]|nr:hypothetical protein HDU97_000650 [Phlyctochytrium planicorne]